MKVSVKGEIETNANGQLICSIVSPDSDKEAEEKVTTEMEEQTIEDQHPNEKFAALLSELNNIVDYRKGTITSVEVILNSYEQLLIETLPANEILAGRFSLHAENMEYIRQLLFDSRHPCSLPEGADLFRLALSRLIHEIEEVILSSARSSDLAVVAGSLWTAN